MRFGIGRDFFINVGIITGHHCNSEMGAAETWNNGGVVAGVWIVICSFIGPFTHLTHATHNRFTC